MKTKLFFRSFLRYSKSTSATFRIAAFFLLISFLNLELGCNYYKVNKISDLNAELSKQNLDIQQKNNRYIIVHKEGLNLHLFNIQLDKDKMVLKASYETAPAEHNLYHAGAHTNRRYYNSNREWNVLDEAHILSDSVIMKEDKTVEIPLASIKRIDIIEQDTGRIVASYIFGFLGIIAFITALIFLLKSSCPFVYVHDGKSYSFRGEIFGGAIFKPLERDDYMPLSTLENDDSLFRISITNELKERQYINTAEVIVAEHEPGEKMLIDSKGNLHTVSDAQPPYEAKLNAGADYTKALASVDSSYCTFSAAGGNHSVNELVLKFNKPSPASSARLILHAKNSLWLDFAFGEMTKLFGVYYNKWVEQKRNDDPEKLIKWTEEQHLPLSVYLKEESGWKLVEQVPSVGPLAARDLCVPLNLENCKTKNVEIKLVCGFMFWEVDYAGIAFSADTNFTHYVLKPSSAIDEKGNDVTGLLENSDQHYLFQPAPGCETSITYRLPQLNKKKQYDVFLHSRGYYEHVRDYTGLPDKKLLESFKEKDAFVDFSKDLYDRLSGNISFTSMDNH